MLQSRDVLCVIIVSMMSQHTNTAMRLHSSNAFIWIKTTLNKTNNERVWETKFLDTWGEWRSQKSSIGGGGVLWRNVMASRVFSSWRPLGVWGLSFHPPEARGSEGGAFRNGRFFNKNNAFLCIRAGQNSYFKAIKSIPSVATPLHAVITQILYAAYSIVFTLKCSVSSQDRIDIR